MKKLLFFVVMIYLYQLSYSQNTIKGQVFDEKNEVLVGVTVYIQEINKGTTTNEHGEYQLYNLPQGEFSLQFSFLGYENRIEKCHLNNSEVELNINLKQSVIETEEIVVTGGYNSSQHENAAKVEILKISNISNINSPNFMEVLTKVPGVDMISKGNGVSKPVIRGLSMNNILVLNNGIRIENYQYSENHPLGIDENSIEKVEIIKGPASLLYGSDAMGGVINFIKEKPAPVGKIVGDYNLKMFSNSTGLNSGFGIKGAGENVFAGIKIGAKSHADYRQGGGEFVKNSRFNEQSLSTNIGFSKSNACFKVYYDYFNQNLGMTVSPVLNIINQRDRKNDIWYQDLEHHLVSSQNNFFLGSAKLELNAAYQVAQRKLQAAVSEPVVEMQLNTTTYDGRLYFPTKNKNEFILGFQGYFQSNQNLNNRVSQFLPNAKINSTAGLFLYQISFADKMKLQTGIRYDFYSIETKPLGTEGSIDYHLPVENSYHNLNGSIGATYKEKKSIFRLNFSKAFRAPNIAELTSNGIHESRFEKGNPDLKPENGYETDASYHFHSDNMTIDLALFYNFIDNYIYIEPSNDTIAGGIKIYNFSQSSAKLYGGEAGIHFHPKHFDWLHFETTFSNVTGKKSSNKFLPFIPANKLFSELRFNKEKIGFLADNYLNISSQYAFAQNMPSDFEEKTEAYFLLNLGIGTNVKIQNQTLNFGFYVNNIFDTKYFDHLSTLKEIGYYNQGRNLIFSMKIPFGIK